MDNTHVPLVVYNEQGEKTEIGDALIHYDGYGNMAIVGSVSNVTYLDLFKDKDLKHLSIHTKEK